MNYNEEKENMKRIVFVISMLWSALLTHAQGVSELRNVPLDELSKEISYKGEFLNCTTWTDKLGENYLITSQSSVHQEELPEGTLLSSKELYARHYIKDGEHFTVLWQLYDFLEGDCGMFTVDYLCKPYINDLDRDGICETWLVYQLGCRTDYGVPLLTMKVIMHSGTKKYAIRGKRDVLYPRPAILPSIPGSFQMDDNYKTLSESVRDFGIVLWHKFQVEELEE